MAEILNADVVLATTLSVNPYTFQRNYDEDAALETLFIQQLGVGSSLTSGTGSYIPFLNQNSNDASSQGFNTSDGLAKAPGNGAGLDMSNTGATTAIQLKDIPIVIGPDGQRYYEIRLDLNEENNSGTDASGAPNRLLSLTEFQLYWSDGQATLADYNAVTFENRAFDAVDGFHLGFDLDANDDRTIVLRDSNPGGGKDDYVFYIPIDSFAGALPTSNVTLFSQFGPNPDEGATPEEWRIRTTSQIDGFKFNDLDSDGQADAGETGAGVFGVSGITIKIYQDQYIDTNGNGFQDAASGNGANAVPAETGNGVFDATDDLIGTVTTDTNGNFTFYNLLPGTYFIQEVVPPGAVSTTDDLITITITSSGQDIAGIGIGNHYLTPNISIDKNFVNVTDGPDPSGGTTVINGAGDIANYTIAVTNNGETGLVNVQLTDILATTLTEQVDGGGFNVGDLNDDDVLDIGEIWQWTATQTATQADLDTNGGTNDSDLDNSATVVATQQGVPGTQVTDTDPAAAPIVRAPAIAITKVFDGWSGGDGDNLGDAAGDVANYTIVVTNTGNVTLTNVVVTDPLTGNVYNVGILAPGASSAPLIENYILTQADLNSNGTLEVNNVFVGSIDNTATATSNQTGPASASAVAPIVQTPVLLIDKTGTTDGGDPDCADVIGENINWTVSVSRAGNVDIDGVVVTDDIDGDGDLDVLVRDDTLSSGDDDGVLEAGETWVYTFANPVTAGMINANQDIVNTAYANGEAVNSSTAAQEVSDSASVDICQYPVLLIDKTGTTDGGDPDCADVIGENINWTVSVSRAGNVDIDGVVVTDDIDGDGDLDVLVRDDTLSSGDDDGVLEAGETWVYTFANPVTAGMINANQDIVNTAYANGEAVNSSTAAQEVSDSASVDICQYPVLLIDKTGTTDGGDPDCADVIGENINWTVSVSRAGNVDIDGVVVTDDIDGDGDLDVLVRDDTLSSGDDDGVLEAGETWVYTFANPVTAGMINANQDIVNTAYANGEAVNSSTAAQEVSDSASVDICQYPVLLIDKTGTTDGGDPDCADVIGENINWTVSVSRAGNVDIDGVVVTDDIDGDGDLDVLVRDDTLSSGDDDGVLEAGETWVYTFANPVTAGMINANQDIVNTAYANGEAVNSSTAAQEVSDSASVDICQYPVLLIDKTGTTDGGDPDCADVIGENINWTVSVSRAGNVDIDGVVVTDDIDGDGDLDVLVRDDTLSSGDDDGVLEAGETWVYTFANPVTAGMINANQDIVNTAYANGEAVNSSTAAQEVSDSASVDICQYPVLLIDKTGTTDGGDPDCADVIGENINWTVSVSRAGNVDIDGVVVTDDIDGDGDLDVLVRDDTLSSGDDDGVLEAGETWVYTFANPVTAGMINANQDIVNTAYANGEAVNSSTAAQEVSDSASVDICQYPVLLIDKTGTTDGGDPDCADVIGENINWTVSVSRAGNVDIDGVVVTDDIDGDGDLDVLVRDDTLSSGDDDGVLEAGETWVYTFANPVTAGMINANQDIVNTAYANGEAVNSSTAAQEVSDSASVDICQLPEITIVKTAFVNSDCADRALEEIDYTIKVTNTGNVSLTQLTVTDDFANAVPLYISGDHDADDLDGDGDLVEGNGVFDVGETWEFGAYHVVTQAEIDAGGNYDSNNDGKYDSLRNVASAIGYTVNNVATELVQDDAVVKVCHDPEIKIVKVGTPPDDCLDAGDTISYTYTVTNTGNVALANVVVDDDKVTVVAVDTDGDAIADNDGDIDGDGLLDLDEAWIYTAQYTVTQEDMDTYGGTGDDKIENRVTANAVAAVSGVIAEEAFDTEELLLCHEYAIDLEKYVSVDSTDGVNGTFTDADSLTGLQVVNVLSDVWFQVTLTNGGNTQLTGIDIKDVNTSNGQAGILFDLMVDGALTANAANNFAATLDGDLDNDGNLDVDETWTITYKQAFDAGQHINTATVTTNELVTDKDDAYYYSLTDCGPGVGTPGFWKNLGYQFWDVNPNNQTKSGDNFPDHDLLVVDKDMDGDYQVGAVGSTDAYLTVNGVKGLLLGDYNMNGLTDAGENTLFISVTDGRKLIDASQKQQQDGKWMLGRDMVASWLNYLAGNAIDFGDNTTAGFNDPFSPKAYLNDAIEWLKEYGDLNDDGILDSTTGSTFVAKANAISTSSVKWSNAALDGVAGNNFSASQAHTALDYYNNTGDVWNPVTMQYVEFACDRDDFMQMQAVSLV